MEKNKLRILNLYYAGRSRASKSLLESPQYLALVYTTVTYFSDLI